MLGIHRLQIDGQSTLQRLTFLLSHHAEWEGYATAEHLSALPLSRVAPLGALRAYKLKVPSGTSRNELKALQKDMQQRDKTVKRIKERLKRALKLQHKKAKRKALYQALDRIAPFIENQ